MSDRKMDTVGDALPREMARVRDVVLPEYDKIPTGIFGATMMRQALDEAARSMAAGDVAAMIRSLEDLKGWQL